MRVHLDGAVRGIGVGPLCPVRGQSILRRAAGQAQQAQKAIQQLLNTGPRTQAAQRDEL